MNRINWLSWNKEAFEQAKEEGKPVLLDIYGVWCHWCHVIDQTTYSDPDVIRIVNDKFVPVRVDTDKRPDVNKRYNQGGWPSTVFLAPNGQIITGTTYVPADMLKDIMLRVIGAFKEIKAADIKLENKQLKTDDGIELNGKIIEKIMESMLDNFDFDYGGFGMQPKFPLPDAIKLALDQYAKTKNKDFSVIARLTLDKMQGIFDDIEGGFYRYSVTQQWNEPHYEKMLETNAGVIHNYLQGFHALKKDEYKEIAIKSLDYIKNNLSNNDGAFYGSQDADEEYYGLNAEERKKHGKPFIDKNIYTDLSSMMISTYAYAYKILKEDYYKIFAIKSIKFLIEKNYDEKFGMFHFFDGKRRFLPGILADNAYFIKALIDVYEITKDKVHINTAEKLNKFVIDNFMDKGDNCFFDKIDNPDDIGFLKFRDKSMIENSIAAINLIKLSKLMDNNETYNNEKINIKSNNKINNSEENKTKIKNIGKDEYLKIAENILKAFYSESDRLGISGAVYGLSVKEYLDAKT